MSLAHKSFYILCTDTASFYCNIRSSGTEAISVLKSDQKGGGKPF